MDLSWFTLMTSTVACYYGLLLAISTYSHKKAERQAHSFAAADADWAPVVVLVVPARNEERVISYTLDALQSSTYPDVLTLVMNDGSDDSTARIVDDRPLDEEIYIVDRPAHEAGRGKGAVLNDAYHRIRSTRTSAHELLRHRSSDEVIICIMDADGVLDADAIEKVVPMFADPTVGAVQIGVRIANSRASILTRMQDIEFVGFSGLVQRARNVFGSASLGGNGQFTRLSALESLGRDPWTDCLSEDLDLSLSLVEQGYSVRFCDDAYVAQQGLTKLRPLLRQRSRWIQGHYQCWRHLPDLLRSTRVRKRTKIDLSIYLTLVLFLVLMTFGVVMNLLSIFGVVSLSNDIWLMIPSGPFRNSLLFALSCGPALAFVFVYQSRAKDRLRPFEIPAFAAAFCLYGYHWLIAQLWAFARIATGRRSWAKTPREIVSEVPAAA